MSTTFEEFQNSRKSVKDVFEHVDGCSHKDQSSKGFIYLNSYWITYSDLDYYTVVICDKYYNKDLTKVELYLYTRLLAEGLLD